MIWFVLCKDTTPDRNMSQPRTKKGAADFNPFLRTAISYNFPYTQDPSTEHAIQSTTFFVCSEVIVNPDLIVHHQP